MTTREVIEIKVLDENVLGYLKTADGLVVLLRNTPETFDVARKMLEILRKRIVKQKKGDKRQ